jgi:hypothetical protein
MTLRSEKAGRSGHADEALTAIARTFGSIEPYTAAP